MNEGEEEGAEREWNGEGGTCHSQLRERGQTALFCFTE